jgi:hypothetical protein
LPIAFNFPEEFRIVERQWEWNHARVLRTWLIGLAMAVASPALTQAQTGNKFDGTYIGLPPTTAGDVHCPQIETPSALTIANSTAQTASGAFTGTVDADGHVVWHWKDVRYEGQVDPSGLVKVAGSTTHGWSTRSAGRSASAPSSRFRRRCAAA